MRMRQSVMVLVCSMLGMVGCASTTPIRYKVTALPTTPIPHGQRLLVAVFDDARPETERIRKPDFGQRDWDTSDKDFKPDVPRQLATALAEHLKRAGVVQEECLIEEVPADLATNGEAMQALAARGIDVVLMGRVMHFRGFQHGMMTSAVFFGLAGVLTEAITNPKYIGGHAAYSPLMLVDVERQRVLWQGDIEHQFDDKQTFYKGHVAYALEALKETNTKVARVVEDTLTGQQQTLTMHQGPPLE